MPTPSEQLLSRTIYDIDGTTTVWDFSFAGGYLDAAHVKAYTELPTGARTAITVTPEMLIGEYQLQITPALPSSAGVLVIYRDTPVSTPLVDFVEGPLTEIALDTNAKQAVFVAAEAQDAMTSSNFGAAIDAAVDAGASAAAANIDAASAASSASGAASSALSASLSAAAADNSADTAALSANAASASALAADASADAAAASAADTEGVRTDLAATAGSALVGYDGGTVQDVLDSAKPLADYTALRAYTGRATSVRITTPGIAGFFIRRGTTGLTDNGGTVIIDAGGRAWERVFDGSADVRIYGARCDNINDDTAAFALAISDVNCNEVLVPYNCKANIVLNAAKVIRGLGRRRVNITSFNDATPTLKVTISRDTDLLGPIAENIAFVNPTGPKAIELINVHDWSTSNVRGLAPNGVGLTLDGSWNGISTGIELKGNTVGLDVVGNVYTSGIEQNVPCDFFSAFIANNGTNVRIRSAGGTATSPGVINFHGGDIEGATGVGVEISALCIANFHGVHMEANAGGDIVSTSDHAQINIFGGGYKITKIQGKGAFSINGMGITTAQAADKVWLDASEMNTLSVRGLRLVPFTSIDSTGIATIKSTRRHHYGISGKSNLIKNGHFAVNATASGWSGYGQTSPSLEARCSYASNNINPEGPGRILTIDGSVWGTFTGLQQGIPRHSNGLVTISFWAKTDTANKSWRFVARNTATAGAIGQTSEIASTTWTHYTMQYYVYDDATHAQIVAFWTNTANPTNKLYIAEFCILHGGDTDGFHMHFTE